jgi:radical SAM superfamily enzyme with C-terminal helix-hairpin-helix motif
VEQSFCKMIQPVDINSARHDQLKALNGIGDIYARKIEEGRPYQNTDELLRKNIIPLSIYKKIKDQIITRTINATDEGYQRRSTGLMRESA